MNTGPFYSQPLGTMNQIRFRRLRISPAEKIDRNCKRRISLMLHIYLTHLKSRQRRLSIAAVVVTVRRIRFVTAELHNACANEKAMLISHELLTVSS